MTRRLVYAAVATIAIALAAASAVSAFMVPHHLIDAHNRLKMHQKKQTDAASRVASAVPPYDYEVRWFNQSVDHFNFQNSELRFAQRYLINDRSWTKPSAANNWVGGPIFFYTGNEGSITDFAANTGQPFEMAPEFGAMVIFGEHRYYGESNPFNNASLAFTNGYTLQWLTSEQALADYAVLLTHIKYTYNSTASPVIAFGGSYGGMLSAWFRLKYPHIVTGSWASSAPILLFPDMVDGDYLEFSRVVTRTFEQANIACSDSIRKSWNILANMQLSDLSNLFRVCSPFTDPSHVQNYLFPYIANAYVSMAMGDYPYEANLVGLMPGNPVNVSCSYFTPGMSDEQIAVAVFNAMSINTNYSGNATCNPVYDPSPSLGPDALLEAGGWSYQSCNEMLMPIAQDGQEDMFYPMPWDINAVTTSCQQTYQTPYKPHAPVPVPDVQPRPSWVKHDYGGHRYWTELATQTNIFLPNGQLDPWSSGGVLSNVSDTLLASYQTGGAHHYDLRPSNPSDTLTVLATRVWAKQQIKAWIANAAPAIPVYTAPDHAWRQSYVVLLSLVGTWLALAIGHFVYNTYISPAKPTASAADSAAAASAAAAAHGGHTHGGGAAQSTDYHKLVDEEKQPSVQSIIKSWPGQAAAAPAEAKSATAAPAAAPAPATVVVASAPESAVVVNTSGPVAAAASN